MYASMVRCPASCWKEEVAVGPGLFERYRKEILQARLMTVFGVWQADAASGGQVMHLVARRVVDHTALLGALSTRSRDFH